MAFSLSISLSLFFMYLSAFVCVCVCVLFCSLGYLSYKIRLPDALVTFTVQGTKGNNVLTTFLFGCFEGGHWFSVFESARGNEITQRGEATFQVSWFHSDTFTKLTKRRTNQGLHQMVRQRERERKKKRPDKVNRHTSGWNTTLQNKKRKKTLWKQKPPKRRTTKNLFGSSSFTSFFLCLPPFSSPPF
jgi:hypothetical protein